MISIKAFYYSRSGVFPPLVWIFLVFICLVFTAACSQKQAPVKVQPEDLISGQLLKAVELLMTKTERKMLKHLPDDAARDEFMRDFWQKRDPDPSTPDNEFLEEFRERIDYANQWFNEMPGRPGWDTERGRIVLQLGIPDTREYSESELTDALGRVLSAKPVPMDRWTYQYFRLVLDFVDQDGLGRYRLLNYPFALLSAIDRAKVSPVTRKKISENQLQFSADFQQDRLIVRIPVSRLQFIENGLKMDAAIDIAVQIYCDHRKVNQISEKKTISRSKEELLIDKFIEIILPFQPREKGNYDAEILVTDQNANSRYRSTCKFHQAD